MPDQSSRRDFLLRTTATGSALAAAAGAQAAGQGTGQSASAGRRPAARPNILFIMTDQHRFDCLGASGNRWIRTPNLDKLAARSANFKHAFVQAPVCVPSRVSFFTGRYPHSHRNRVNYTPLDRDETLLPEYLRRAGYNTAAVGKLHLHPPTPAEARRVGFGRVLLHDAVPKTDRFSDYVKWRAKNDPKKDVHYRALARDIQPGKNPFRAAIEDAFTETTWTGLQTRAFLRELAEAGEPFFLFSSFWKPHSPYEVPAPFDAMYDGVDLPLPPAVTLEDIRRLPGPVQKQILRGKPQYKTDRTRLGWIYRSYYAAISQIDREVGLMLETLEQTGCAENTIVVFSSDHGDQLLEHGLFEKNVFFEGSVRVPFLIRWTGRIRSGSYAELIETVDLPPTLFALAGLDEPYHCQGRSFAGLIAEGFGDYAPREVVHAENIIPEVITSGGLNFRFEKGRGVGGIRHPDAKMVRSTKWKFNYYPEGCGELYDLDNDPGETRNLFDDPKHKETVAEMNERILHWLITSEETEQIAEKWML